MSQLKQKYKYSEFCDQIIGILKECGNRVWLEKINEHYMKKYKVSIKSLFEITSKTTLLKLMAGIMSDILDFDSEAEKPHVVVTFKGRKPLPIDYYHDRLNAMSSEEQEQELVNNVTMIKGSSQANAICLDDDEDDEDGALESSSYLPLSRKKFNDYNIIDLNFNSEHKFEYYQKLKSIHINYSKLRIAIMCNSFPRTQYDVMNFIKLFKHIYHENFLNKNILKSFIGSCGNRLEYITKFLKIHCGDLLDVSDDHKVIEVKANSAIMHIKYLNDLLQGLEQLERQQQLDPTPTEMMLLGSASLVDVKGTRDIKGNHSFALDFPGPNSHKNLSENQRPSMSEVNERVNQIRNKICRQGKAVNVPDIVKLLCEFYGVSNVCDIRTSDSKYLFRKESDIPAVNEIFRLQGRVNAFMQAFITFRAVCTLHELHDEICKMERRSIFEELKLGPLQRQLLVYEYFQFPYDQQAIPTIKTLDVLKLLWSELNKLYYESRRKGEEQQKNITLIDFMEAVRKEYGFKTPFESGVKIQSIALATQVVRKAWFGNMHNIKEVTNDFTNQVIIELKQYLNNLKQNYFKEGGIKEKVANMDSLQAFSHLFTLLNNLKKEACQRLPGAEVFVKFSDLTMNIFTIIQKDEIMRLVFLLILSLAPMKAIETSDVKVLKYLGFGNAIKFIISEEETKAMSTQNLNGKQPVAKASITKAILKWLSKYDHLDLKTLSKIEGRVLRDIRQNCNSFEELGHSTFLKFICSEENLLELLQSSMNVGRMTSSNIPTKKELLNFMLQCGNTSSEESILRALSIQFHIKDDIDLKQISNVLRMINTEKTVVKTIIGYQQALISSTVIDELEPSFKPTQSTVNRAITMINAAPFMESVEDWINWDSMFFQTLGTLKSFLMSNFSYESSEFVLLEISSNYHIKIFKECTTEMFQNALNLFDASNSKTCIISARIASTCIVSLIYSCGHMQNAPIALFGNYIQIKLLQESKHESKQSKNILKFILQCFQFIPFDILHAVVSKLFLVPLSTLYGTMNMSQLLLGACSSQKEERILHALGYVLADKVWIESLEVETEKCLQLMSNWRSTLENSVNISEDNLHKDLGEKTFQGDLSLEAEVATVKCESEEREEETPEIAAAQLQVVNSSLESALASGKGEVVESITNTNRQLAESKQIIETIRKEQFGVGVVFTSEEQKKLFETHRKREGRSLYRLSKELYSRDSHFVLELIQNADDNTYNMGNFSLGETASIAFILEQKRIIILNNEVGFSEANIRALCDVGKSTKGIHEKGYIGQKGIGFKSVFRVSDCPEIHSNGFHIKFDASKGPNGYILPDWVETEERRFKYNFDGILYHWKTKIILPLKEEMQHKNLTSRFHDIHPSLLMFLNRLHKIIIYDTINDKMKIMEKSNVGNNIIKLTQNGNSSLWFVVSKEVEINLYDELKKTDISIAFPFDRSLRFQDLGFQPVFAFLPLRSYGFKFIIQADFEVPSSREDIDKDSAWNQCILQNIPSLVISAFYKFKSHPHFTGLEGLVDFFKFMELEGHVLGIFKQVARNIIKSLQKEECLPINKVDQKIVESEGMQVGSHEYYWGIPSSLVLSKSSLVKMISPSLLQTTLGLSYLHEEVIKKVDRSVLLSLGVNEVSIDQLLDITKSFLQNLHKNKSATIEAIKNMNAWVGRWLCLLFNTLQEAYDCTDESLDKVKNLQMFPLSDGTYVSLKDTLVFLPVEDENVIHKNKARNQPLQLIECDLNILSRSLFEDLDQLEYHQVLQFIKDLGVKAIRPRDLIYDQIIPIFLTGKWQGKSEELLVAFVKYLHQQLENKTYNIDDVKNIIIIKTNKGFKSLSQGDIIYISHHYGNPINLEKDLASCDWLLVSPAYTTGYSKAELKSWYDFFVQLGMKSFVTIQKKKIVLHKTDLVGTVWDKLCKTWPETEDDNYVISDLECPELTPLLRGNKEEEIKLFSFLLSDVWECDFKTHDLLRPTCSVEDTNGLMITTTYSSFFMQMRSSQWLPSTNGQLFKPSDLYLLADLTHRLLSGKVNYLHHRITNKDFITTLGVQTDITFENFMKAFSKWITETTFSTSREHVFNIYEYFMEQYKYHPNEIKSLLDLPFIYLPSIWASNGTIEGQFHKVDCVSWRDPSEVFKKIKDVSMRKILRLFYPEKFKEFFVGIVGVDEYPSREEYLRLITNITSVTSLPNRGKCFEVFMLMAVLGETFLNTHSLDIINEIDYPQNTAEKYKLYEDLREYYVPDSLIQAKKAGISDRSIFPTVGNFFVSLDQEPILVINQDLAKVYRNNHSTVPMIFADTVYEILQEGQKRRLIADSLFLKVLVFFKVCQLSTLKELYLEPEVITEQMNRGCASWENLLHDITPITQRYISSLLPNIHEEMQTKIFISDKDGEYKFSDYLTNSKFFTVQRLQVIYRLKGRKDVNITREKVCNVESCGNKALIYINKAAVNAKDHYESILLELLRLFLQDEEQRERLHEFIMTYSIIPDKDRYLQRKKVKDIYDREIWNYPEPITEEASKPISLTKDQPKPIGTVNSGEKGLACWPPQNPRKSLGIITKPESVKEHERIILGKLQPPVAFSNITQLATDMDIVTDKPTAHLRAIKDDLSGQGTSNIQKNKVTAEVSQISTQKVTKTNLGITKAPGESETSLAGKRKRNSNLQTSADDVAELELDINIPQSKKLLMLDTEVFTDNSNSSKKDANDKLKPDKGSVKSSGKRKYIFNPDNFIATPIDAEYEDLPIHLEQDYVDTFKDFSEKVDPNDFTKFLGNAGENIVYTYLYQQNETRIKSGDMKIEWLNNDLETGEPYDIKISESDGKIIYIEVKSTRNHSKKEFEISSQQIKFAFEQGSNFHLYRVSGLTSTSKVRIRRLVNLSMYLNNKSVRLYMVL